MARKYLFVVISIVLSTYVFAQNNIGNSILQNVPCTNYKLTEVFDDTLNANTFSIYYCQGTGTTDPQTYPQIQTTTNPFAYNAVATPTFNLVSGSYGIQTKQVNNKFYYADTAHIYCLLTNSYTPVWTYTLNSSTGRIAGFQVKNDTMFVLHNDPTSFSTIEVINILTGSTYTNYPNPGGNSPSFLIGDIKDVELMNNKLLLAGRFVAYDDLGAFVDSNLIYMNITNGTLHPLNLKVNDTIKDIELKNNKLHIAGAFTMVNNSARQRYAVIDNAFNLLPSSINFDKTVEQIEFYDKYLLALGKFTQVNSTNVNATSNYTVCSIDLNNSSVKNLGPVIPNNISNDDYLFKIIQNRLYISSRTVPFTYNRTVLAPALSTNSITSSSAVFCQNTPNVTFSISPALYVTSYNWSFSGTGTTLTFTNNIAKLDFSSIATSGILKVFALSSEGASSDTISLTITVNPRPNITVALPISNITCFNKKVPIQSNSITSNVAYSWTGPSGYTSNNKNDSTGYLIPGKYIATVTNTMTGCLKRDSVFVGIDTLRPIVIVPPSPVDLYCSPDSSLLNGSSSSPSPSIWWHIANSGVQHPNPYYTKNIGNYYLVVKNMVNGCIDSTTFTVGDKRVLPNVKITSHTYVSPLIPIDTITCTKTLINLVAASDTINTVFSWKSIPGNIVSPNPLSLSAQGNYKLLVNRTDNGCADSSLIVYIAQNITVPNISVTTPSASINCSSSTATLNANTSFTTTTLSWTGPSGFTSSNPAITGTQGLYYVHAISSVNGCTKKDSVVVNYNSTLLVHTNNDTTVCKNALVNLQASITGTLTGVTYSWSNSSSGQSINVNPNATTQFIVTASTISGCSGKDSVLVTIPSDIKDSVITTKSCNGATVGSITIYANGGIAPYLYSFNGAAFTSQTTYTNLPYATYPIIIKDALGCIKSTSASINQNSSLPVPVFIASTQNIQGDTIVLVDLTVPKADSLQWLLPSSASIVGGDMFNPLVYFADTGNFVITLTAFYADCNISTTKNIHVGPVDTTMASATNNNGIKSITLYPNPNTGLFIADIEFYKKQNSSVQVFDAVSVKYFQQNFLDTNFISLPVDVSTLSNGTYIFKVIGEYNSKHVNFVISK